MTTKEIEQAFDISNMLPNKVLKDDAEILKHIKHCVGISKAFTDSFMVDKSIIEDIKAEIESCRGKFYQNEDNTYSPYMDGTLDRVLEIIDRHCGGENE